MGWSRVSFDNALTHATPDLYLDALTAEMKDRGCPVKDFVASYGTEHAAALGSNPKPITAWGIDFGGMINLNEPRVAIELSELSLDIRCAQVSAALKLLRQCPLRQFTAGQKMPLGYYKIRHWHHATVLTPFHYRILCNRLAELEADAERQAREFFEGPLVPN